MCEPQGIFVQYIVHTGSMTYGTAKAAYNRQHILFLTHPYLEKVYIQCLVRGRSTPYGLRSMSRSDPTGEGMHMCVRVSVSSNLLTKEGESLFDELIQGLTGKVNSIM